MKDTPHKEAQDLIEKWESFEKWIKKFGSKILLLLFIFPYSILFFIWLGY